jgi:hypothetical protein
MTATTKKITQAQVIRAREAADRAALAVERHQMRNGYGRSNNRTRELRVKAQQLSNKAFDLKYAFERQSAESK